MIQIFDESNDKNPDGSYRSKQPNKQSINVKLAALKIIELLSIQQIEEFYLYQHVFMFDYYGVSLDMLNRRNEPDFHEVISPFRFSPYVSKSLPPNISVDYLSNTFEKEGFRIDTCKKQKRRILITQNYFETELELQAKAHELLTYCILLNQTRVYVDKEDIESLIQGDFIGMHEFMDL